ncbi:MAG: hypothetical protein R2758_03315 [Bacteroidales bacterium]
MPSSSRRSRLAIEIASTLSITLEMGERPGLRTATLPIIKIRKIPFISKYHPQVLHIAETVNVTRSAQEYKPVVLTREKVPSAPYLPLLVLTSPEVRIRVRRSSS